MRESLARRKIRQAVEAKGYTLAELTWEPWGRPAEKEGIPGGWEGWVEPRPDNGIISVSLTIGDGGTSLDRGPDIMGLSWQEAVEWVEQFIPARQPNSQSVPRP